MTSGVLPFFALALLNIQIYRGLQAVQRNLGRHQRLATAAEQRVHREEQKAKEKASKAKAKASNNNGHAANGNAVDQEVVRANGGE